MVGHFISSLQTSCLSIPDASCLVRFPEQRLTRAQALKGMTLDAAYASFSENTMGSLTPGKKADFVVLDRDIMTVPFSDILETKVSATVIDGEVMYGYL
jgi:predicted amidohydrolase YtcJ